MYISILRGSVQIGTCHVLSREAITNITIYNDLVYMAIDLKWAFSVLIPQNENHLIKAYMAEWYSFKYI